MTGYSSAYDYAIERLLPRYDQATLTPGKPITATKARPWFCQALLSAVPDECQLWPFATTGSHGKLMCKWGGSSNRFHDSLVTSRLACLWRWGPPPDSDPRKFGAAHGPCDPLCTNWWHLSWKDQHDNQLDRERDGTGCRGARNNRTKLTPEDVRDIRRRAALLAQDRYLNVSWLGAEYGVTGGAVASILSGRTWSWLD